jgi:hypothetical protein
MVSSVAGVLPPVTDHLDRPETVGVVVIHGNGEAEPGWINPWTNLYRIDDPIGGHVKLAGQPVVTRVLGFGGHSDYWADCDVNRVIFQVLTMPYAATPCLDKVGEAEAIRWTWWPGGDA